MKKCLYSSLSRAKGNIVELGDFGTFWLRTSSEGAASAEEVRGDQISGVMPRFNPGKEFKRVLDLIKFNKTQLEHCLHNKRTENEHGDGLT